MRKALLILFLLYIFAPAGAYSQSEYRTLSQGTNGDQTITVTLIERETQTEEGPRTDLVFAVKNQGRRAVSLNFPLDKYYYITKDGGRFVLEPEYYQAKRIIEPGKYLGVGFGKSSGNYEAFKEAIKNSAVESVYVELDYKKTKIKVK